MTTEMTIELLKEEIKSQKELIKLLVLFYDHSSNIQDGECLNDLRSLSSEIEDKFDIDVYRN